MFDVSTSVTLPGGPFRNAPLYYALSLSEPSRLTIESIVRSHFQLVWRTLRRFGLNEADADDGAQEVFLVVHKKLSAIEAGKERSFLISTARRVASVRRRSLVRRREQSEDEGPEGVSTLTSPEEVRSLREARVYLDLILESMPEEVREVFVLFELERLTGPEIASLLALPEGTVSTRLRRGREIFQKSAARLSLGEEDQIA